MSFSSNRKWNFCRETDHYGSDCPTYPPLSSREQKASELGLCLRCLSSRHQSCNCSTIIRKCRKCEKVHHTALCDLPKEKTSASKSEPHISEYGDESQSSDEYSSTVVPSFRFGTSPTMRLLMWCKVVAYNLDLPKHRQPIVIFLILVLIEHSSRSSYHIGWNYASLISNTSLLLSLVNQAYSLIRLSFTASDWRLWREFSSKLKQVQVQQW